MKTKSILAVLLASLLASALAFAQSTTRASVTSDGTQANLDSYSASISADGRFVAFESIATNLGGAPLGPLQQVYLHDRLARTTRLVSISSTGEQGNGASSTAQSEAVSISGDGRYIAFESGATNLVSGDTNATVDIFVHDRIDRRTTRVSVSSGGGQAGAGVSLFSYAPEISSDGRYVAFASYATNLVAGDTNGEPDVFVHDRQTAQTTRVSVSNTGAQGVGGSEFPDISADGRIVVFMSDAALVANDTNGVPDIYARDVVLGQTRRISVSSTGVQGDGFSDLPSISSDGRYVAFVDSSSNLVAGDTNFTDDIFVHDRQTGQTTRVSVATGGAQSNDVSWRPSISMDGRYVAFSSNATNLVANDTNGDSDIFLHDRQSGQTTRISVSTASAQGNDFSEKPYLSADARYVAFLSRATNLVAGDTNNADDVFVRDRGVPPATATLTAPASVPSCAGSTYPMSVSWSSEGTSFCRAEIPDAVSPTAQPDQCLRGGSLPARGSFWTTARCSAGLCPDANDRSKLAPTQSGQIVQVCQGLLGLSPPQTSINLRLVCTTPSGGTVSSNRTVAIRAPLAGECAAPAYAQSNNLGSPQAAWGGGTELSGTVTGVPPGTELTASLLREGERGETTVWMEGNTLKLRYRDNPGPQPLQITETVTVAVSDGVSSTQRDYTFTVTSSYVFDNGFE